METVSGFAWIEVGGVTNGPDNVNNITKTPISNEIVDVNFFIILINYYFINFSVVWYPD
ncbi:MAG: hypothetical protein WCP24_03635 [bacterium]